MVGREPLRSKSMTIKREDLDSRQVGRPFVGRPRHCGGVLRL